MKINNIKLFLVFIFCFAGFSAGAQDRILTLQGEEIICKVKEIDSVTIFYTKADTSTKPLTYASQTQQIKVADVFMIKYTNGSKDVFTQNLPAETKPTVNQESNDEIAEKSYAELYEIGQQDAASNYKGTTPFLIGGLCGITFGYGLIPAVVIAAVPPKPTFETTSNPSVLYNPGYNAGFKSKAHSKKALNVAGGYLVGLATDILIVAAMLSL
jgi:hypothetical protein